LSEANDTGNAEVSVGAKRATGRLVVAVIAACIVTIVLNRTGMFLIQQMLFAQDSLRDGSVAMFTLVVPAFCGGLSAGAIAPKSGMTVGLLGGLLAGLIGAVLPVWQHALVSEHSARSALMHYLTTNPIVTVSFATLGGWFAGQFGTGRFRFEDSAPVRPDESD